MIATRSVRLEDAVFGRVGDIDSEALVDLVAPNAAVVKSLEVKEHAFDHLTGVVDGREVTWAERR
jgi:hypothetical protein